MAAALALSLGGSRLSAQAPPSPHVAAVEARAIRAARARSNRAIAAHDTAAIAAEWMPDISVVTSGSQKLAGRDENIVTLAQQFAERPDVVYLREPDSVRVWMPWEMAAEYGRWRGHWMQRGEKIEIGGPYFAKWQRRDGHWLIQAEIFVPGWCRGGTFCAARP